MSRTILIIIGLLCAVITTVFIIDFTQSISEQIRIDGHDKGLAYYDQYDYDKAIAEFNKIIRFDRFGDVHNSMGLAYWGKEDYDQAIRYFSKAIEFNPKYESFYSNRASIYFEKGKYAQALADFNKIMELNPNDPHRRSYAVEIGEAYLNTGNYDKAIEEFTNIINHPEDYDYYRATYGRGLAYAKKGDREKAIKDLKTVTGLYSIYDTDARDALRELGVTDSQTDQAKENETDVIDFTGTVLECRRPKASEMAIFTGNVRSNWIVRIKIKETSKEDPWVQPNIETNFWVHSPSNLFDDDYTKAIGKDYRFRLSRSRDEKKTALKVIDKTKPAEKRK